MDISAFLRLETRALLYATSPFSFTVQHLNAGMLLYSRSGAGEISCNGSSILIEENSFLFMDCNRIFTLRAQLLPWDFEIFFFTGDPVSVFSGLIKRKINPLFLTDTLSWKRKTASYLGCSLDISEKEMLRLHLSLTELLCEYTTKIMPSPSSDLLPSGKNPLPDYLIRTKNHIDHNYTEEITLETLEVRTGISKYRLCREFSNAFGCPPQKYLTALRLIHSKKMLLHSDLSIQEISSNIGYENPSHFINVFKRYIGTTPKAFRQMAPEERSSLHSLLEQIFPEA